MNIEKAKEFATQKHKGQTRRSGGPYVEHPFRVASIVSEITQDETLIITALLHDVLEDTDCTLEEIESLFAKQVAINVVELTSDKNQTKINKTAYLIEKMNKMSADTLLVKLADRLDNVSDLSTSNLEWSKSYAESTNKILCSLTNFNITSQHLHLIARINEKIVPYF